MERFIRYFLDGVNNSMIIGVPNFNENNQYQDGKNLYNDFYIAKKIVLGKKLEKTTSKKSRK